MKRKYIIILILTLVLLPLKALAAGGFGVSNSSVSMYPGETMTITISSYNAVGKLNISSSNAGVASVNIGSLFIQNPGSSGSITITANSVGSSTISVVASDNFATMDEEILAGQTQTIVVNVVERPVPTPEPAPVQQPNNNKNNNNNGHSNNVTKSDKSTNNKLKSLSIEGYKLDKIDENNYSLTVPNNVTSINLVAEAEDSKAKINGIGNKEIVVGENIFEIIVVSESGSENKINVKVIKKDGYYLEDLDKVLKDNNITNVQIIINKNNKITKEHLKSIKSSKKIINFNYYDENKKLIYSWQFDGGKIKDINDINTDITFSSENDDKIYKKSNYASGMILNFAHTGNLPSGTKIKIYVGDRYKDGSVLNIYQYNTKSMELDFVKNNIISKDGYIEFDINHCSEYFITMSKIPNSISSKSNNSFIIISVIEFLVIVWGVIYYFIKTKFKTKPNKNIMNNYQQ